MSNYARPQSYRCNWFFQRKDWCQAFDKWTKSLPYTDHSHVSTVLLHRAYNAPYNYTQAHLDQRTNRNRAQSLGSFNLDNGRKTNITSNGSEMCVYRSFTFRLQRFSRDLIKQSYEMVLLTTRCCNYGKSSK